MIKNYIIDTNVLLQDSSSIFKFQDNNVIIPIGVIEELDKFKKNVDELGRNAREVSRSLDELREKGDLRKGVLTSSGGTVAVRYNGNFGSLMKETNVDLHVIHLAQKIMDQDKDTPTIIVSRDLNVRIRATAMGLKAEDYANTKVEYKDVADGHTEIQLEPVLFSELRERKKISVADIDNPDFPMFPNYYYVVSNRDNPYGGTILARMNTSGTHIGLLIGHPNGLNIKPKNKEQNFVMDALLDNDIKLVAIAGIAGSGKTLLSVAVGMHLVEIEKKYKRLLVSRPVFPMGKDIGYLPGDINEKLTPWMTPIYDAFEVFNKNKNMSGKEMVAQDPKILVEPLTYIRGRSIHDQILLVDECLHGDTYIKTETGKLKIKSIVDRIEKKEKIKVLSYNEQDKTFEYKDVYDGKCMGERNIFEIQLCKQKIKCSGNHRFLTNNGWKQADALRAGDLIVSSSDETNQFASAMTHVQKQIILGSFLGDGNIDHNSKNKIRLKIVHGFDQIEYNEWKSEFFNANVHINKVAGYSKKPTNSFISKYFANEFSELLPKNKKYCPKFVMDEIDAMGLAIWFMDDGSSYREKNGARIFTCSFDKDSNEYMAKILNEKFNIVCRVLYDKRNSGYYYISLTNKGYERLCSIVDKYIHPSMRYKMISQADVDLSLSWGGKCNNHGFGVIDKVVNTGFSEKVYDISVIDNNNFVVCSGSRGKFKQLCGVVAHNCQNLTPLEIKTIITRAGDNTKVILTGDIYQIDNPYIDATSNGLSMVLSAFKDSSLSAGIIMTAGVRSALAEEAAKRL